MLLLLLYLPVYLNLNWPILVEYRIHVGHPDLFGVENVATFSLSELHMDLICLQNMS